MVSLEQIQKLEEKIHKAVELIKALKEENSIVKLELESANKKVEELEQMISDYRSSQVEIEESIVNAIKQLDDLDKISAADPDQELKASRAEAASDIKPETNIQFKNFSTDANEIETDDDLDILSSNSLLEKAAAKQTESTPSEKNEASQLDIF